MKVEGVLQGILVLQHKLPLVIRSQLTVPVIALISRSVGIAGSLMDQDVLSVTSAQPLQHPSAMMVQSANNYLLTLTKTEDVFLENERIFFIV